MNRLVVAGEDEWYLEPHAHVIVYETGDGTGLITIYDCGASQKPPSAQVIGDLVRIDADHELQFQPTGYIAKLRERTTLERQAEHHWVIRAVDGDAPTH